MSAYDCPDRTRVRLARQASTEPATRRQAIDRDQVGQGGPREPCISADQHGPLEQEAKPDGLDPLAKRLSTPLDDGSGAVDQTAHE